MSDMLDDVAAFLMHRSADEGRSDTTRMAIYAVVGAYQESYDPAQIDDIVRAAAVRFADHPAYRPQWRPTEAEVARAAPVLERIFREVRAETGVSDSAPPRAT